MFIHVDRIASNSDSSLSLIRVDDYTCFAVEDEYRTVKVWGETRIPAGVYEIKLRDDGGMNRRYKAKYGEAHKGMLWLQNVPNFELVYIHPGNDDDDTAGCILPGELATTQYSVRNSTNAYRIIYDKVIAALEAGENVFVDITDHDKVLTV